ncbi:hypothetical protein AVEN_202787-1 [Araneus ventricosus]|uniref:Uncharacterized protein n=1 Tax=Araneus ventricosus TaxID=182803 RepID=A0A4Y2C4V4_ARAVE|nr:hypothetical protein AVEN_33604-1 [Araneus ventricosus]GBL98805.1 hypothetical protein AVEN_109169-1 [Araneus ventricosus]GBL98813.1 hypothetical protein AVEN_138151-1 [Araneus ventricosus]GBL98823.1 hypothetical protein AVEN_202787-1 [Araneus ventricosus]
MAAKGTETRIATGDADTYIEIWVREINFSSQGKDVDIVVLLFALALPKSNIYFIKPGKEKVEAKLFFQETFRKNFLLPKPCQKKACSMHSVDASLHQILVEKAKHYSYFVQRSTKPDKHIADIFYNPSSTPDDILEAGEKMFLVQSRC